MTGEVVDVGTGEGFAVPGFPSLLRPDDGSVADLLLVDRTDGGGRTAYDLRTGREVWTPATSPGAPRRCWTAVCWRSPVTRCGRRTPGRVRRCGPRPGTGLDSARS